MFYSEGGDRMNHCNTVWERAAAFIIFWVGRSA